jgi:hypothetical protein
VDRNRGVDSTRVDRGGGAPGITLPRRYTLVLRSTRSLLHSSDPYHSDRTQVDGNPLAGRDPARLFVRTLRRCARGPAPVRHPKRPTAQVWVRAHARPVRWRRRLDADARVCWSLKEALVPSEEGDGCGDALHRSFLARAGTWDAPRKSPYLLFSRNGALPVGEVLPEVPCPCLKEVTSEVRRPSGLTELPSGVSQSLNHVGGRKRSTLTQPARTAGFSEDVNP